MRVLHVCSEFYPILKTGGLADVAGALPLALQRFNVDSRVLLPGFPAFLDQVIDQDQLAEIPSPLTTKPIQIVKGKVATGLSIYLIKFPDFFDRPGNPYVNADNQAYPDNYLRFALLGWVAARLSEGLDPEWAPNIVHGHDWHAGLMPAYLKASEIASGRKSAASVFTIHNLAYQGVFPSQVFRELDLPNHFFNMHGLEFYGQVSFLKAGLYFADKLTTVSPTYATEIQGEEQGCGLSGLLEYRKQDLYGILNGVDDRVWNPELDPVIASNYNSKSLASKLKCKTALQEVAGLKVQNDAPLFGIVSRLTEQKGLNLVLSGLNEILSRGGQVIVLGSGESKLEEAFKSAAAIHPESVAVQIGYDEDHAHRIIAGSDIIMVPSRFEPCGLTQLYGLSYGTLPLVRKVGGLADTVVDSSLENLLDSISTGFVFNQFSTEDFTLAVRRAFALFNRKSDWKKVQKTAMAQQFGWEAAAKEYVQLYQQLVN